MLFFLNMYFYVALTKSLEMSRTDLAAAPSITCWQGEHVPLVVIGVFALVCYGAGVLMYCYVLFVLLPRRNADNPRFAANFGFLFQRFEPRFCQRRPGLTRRRAGPSPP